MDLLTLVLFIQWNVSFGSGTKGMARKAKKVCCYPARRNAAEQTESTWAQVLRKTIYHIIYNSIINKWMQKHSSYAIHEHQTAL